MISHALTPLAVLAGATLFAGCVSQRLEASAPMRVRNQHPAQLTAIHAGARRPHPVAPGKLEVGSTLAWTSLWLRSGAGSDVTRQDGELIRTTTYALIGLAPSIDFEIEIPFMHTSGGFADEIIDGYHDAFSLKDGDRSLFPRDQFEVIAQKRQGDGSLATAYQLEANGYRIGDLPLFLTWFPVSAPGGGGLSFGLRAGIELPTGDESAGLGNGGTDYSVGFLGGYSGAGYSFFLWGSRAWVRSAATARRAGLGYPEIDSVGVGSELGLTDKLSSLVQVEWERSLLRDLDNSHADREQVQLWLGLRYRSSKHVSVELGFGEDLVTSVSPDLTVYWGVTVRL